MAQRSDKRSNNTNIGCIWGLIHMFNFRQDSSKLLPERRHRNRKRLGSWYSRRTRLLTEPEKKHEDLECGQEATKPRQSIKKLLEKEMSNVKQSRASNVESDQTTVCYNKNKNSLRMHQNSDVVHAMHPSELRDKSVSELVQRISNNIVTVLEEEKIPKKKDKKSRIGSGRDSHHENANIETYNHVGQAEMKFFQHHFIFQVLESLIFDNLTLAKHIISQCLSSQSEELRKSLEILSSNKELLLKVLQDTKPNLLKDIQDQQGTLRTRTHEEQSSKRLIECDWLDYEIGDPRQSKDLDIHEPLLKDTDTFVSHNKIVVLKPHPSGSGKFSNVPSQSSLNALNKMEPGEKERSATPIFFQDIKRRLRLLLGDGKKDQHSVEIDGQSCSLEQEQTSVGSTRVDTSLILKEPDTNNESELAVKASDTDTLYTSDDAIFPRKPQIDFVDLLDYGDNDKKLTFMVSRSSKNLVLLPEPSSSQNSLVKDVDLIMPVEKTNYHCANQDTDVNFFRSSILNLETSTSGGGGTIQMFNWSSGCLDAQTQDIIPYRENPTPKDSSGNKESGVSGIVEHASVPKIAISKVESDGSAEFVHDDSYSKLDLYFEKPQDLYFEKPQPEMPMALKDNSKDLDSHGQKTEKCSPLSVLEPMFLERFVSPGSMLTKHAKNAIPPRRLSFENNNSSESGCLTAIFLGTQMTTCVNNDKFKYEYLCSLLEASALCNGHFSEKVESPNQLLDPSLYDEVETPCEEIPDDLRLFFDSVNEVLVEIYEKSSTPMPWVSFYKPGVPFPFGENLIKEAWRGLNCVFVPCLAASLDDIVKKDFETQPWMDIRWGAEETGFDFSDAIMESLLEEIIHELCELTLSP